MDDEISVRNEFDKLTKMGFVVTQGGDVVLTEDEYYSIFLENGTVDLSRDGRVYRNLKIMPSRIDCC